MVTSGRKPKAKAYLAERSLADERLGTLLNDKSKVVHHAISISNSTIKPHKLLILVDLQGIYLGLHKWLSESNVPIDDGVILGSFAHLQIERVAQEVASRVVKSQPKPSFDLKHLFDSVEINYVDGKAHLGNTLNIAKDGTYLDISMSFEMFYAPVPLKQIEWQLMGPARRGSAEARAQLRKAKLGVVTRKGAFERNYKAYDDFVSYLKESTYHARSHEGFFGYYVGDHGLKYFDEKEVDLRIAIRAMDALHSREADSLCVVSSDQDFIPLHSRADDFGIISFQADLAKFAEQDKIGAKLKGMKDRFIGGGIDPNWPLQIMIQGMSAPTMGHFAQHNYSKNEWDALCRLHNHFNEVKIELIEDPSGKPGLSMYRPK